MLRAIAPLLFTSIEARFESAYSPEESLLRLRAATSRSAWSSLARQAAVGSVGNSHVRLQRYIPLVANSFRPVFLGSFCEAGGRVALVGNFSVDREVRVLMVVWFGLASLALGLMPFASFQDVERRILGAVVCIGLLAAGTVMVIMGRWFARNDVRWLSRLIQGTLEARGAA